MAVFQSLYQGFKSSSAFLKQLTYRVASHKPTPKITFQSLPNELLLEIFSFLELKPYILCHGVCQKWRQLLPSTNMDPIRERLFDLYHEVLNTSGFEEAFEWTDKHLQPFDREEYIRCLLTQYPAIPDEFRMWILEWPARMAIKSTWPGLPFIFCTERRPITRRHGVNWIAYRSFSPQLSAVVYKRGTPSEVSVPALLLWRVATQVDWLCFEQDDPDLFGRVFRFDAHDHSLGGIPYYPPREDAESYNSDLSTFEDWIDYLEDLWDYNCDSLRSRSQVYPQEDLSIHLPLFCDFDSPLKTVLPAPAWNRDSIMQ